MTREERFKMNMIDEFKQMCEIVEKDGRIIVNKQRMLKALEQEPKIGNWKHNKCDMCGASRPPLFDNFCPNCGAKMQEVEE